MKKYLAIILTLVLCMALLFSLSGCTMPATATSDGGDTVAGVAIKNALNVIEALCLTLLSVAGAAWAAKCKDKAYLQNINIAVDGLTRMAKITVGELKQTVVDKLKTENEDGKLTPEQIEELKRLLLEKTLAKLDAPTKELLDAAGADLCAIITGVGEDWVRELNGNLVILPVPSDEPNPDPKPEPDPEPEPPTGEE